MAQDILFQDKSRKMPKWIVLQLLEACNLRCKMCYEWGESGSYHTKEQLSVLDYSVIEKLVEHCAPAHPYYELFGGEPLLYPRIEEVIAHIGKHGSKVDIATNGTLLADYAPMLMSSALSRIWVSIDGPEEINDLQRGKNTYRKAVEGVKKLLALRTGRETFPKVGITTIVTPANAHCLEAFFMDFTKECKIDHASFEFQNFGTQERYEAYCTFMEEHFGLQDTSSAKGLVQDLSVFASIDTASLAGQIDRIKTHCLHNGIRFYHNPSTIQSENYHNYFTAHWADMEDKKTRCPFVWLHAEVSARGNVSMCHTFQDLSFGNVNETDFLSIWNCEKSQQFRNLLRKGLLPMCIACSRYYTQTVGHCD